MKTLKAGALGALLTLIGILYQPAYACGCIGDPPQPTCVIDKTVGNCQNPCRERDNGTYSFQYKNEDFSGPVIKGKILCTARKLAQPANLSVKNTDKVAVKMTPLKHGVEYAVLATPGEARVAHIRRFDQNGFSRFDFNFAAREELCVKNDDAVIDYKTGKLFTGKFKDSSGKVLVYEKGRDVTGG